MRSVNIYHWVRVPGQVNPSREFAGRGLFHLWGTEFVEGGAGEQSYTFTAAIVEMDDGRVRVVPPELVEFVKENSSEEDPEINLLNALVTDHPVAMQGVIAGRNVPGAYAEDPRTVCTDHGLHCSQSPLGFLNQMRVVRGLRKIYATTDAGGRVVSFA